MGSPTKNKFKEGFQHQMLTNYYLSKYDKYMSKFGKDQKQKQKSYLSHNYQTQQKDRINNKRKNFKEAMMERKGNKINQKHQKRSQSRSKSPRSPSFRKNFKEEIQIKNSQQKIQKQNKRNFYRLQDTIISQLYKPSPSKIERSRFVQIQIQHKVTYDQKPQPFKLEQHIQQDDSIQITTSNQIYTERVAKSGYEVGNEKIQLEKISQAIKTTFQKRSPRNSKNKSISPQHKSRTSPKKNNQKSMSAKSNYPQFLQQSHNQSELFQSVRPNFANFDDKKISTSKKQNSQSQSSIFQGTNNRMMMDLMGETEQQKSHHSRQNHNSSKSSQQFKVMRKGSMASSIGGDRFKYPPQDSSFHGNILPQIEREPRMSSQSKQRQQYSQQNKSFSSSRAKDSQQKQSMHELSMISRFSMTSTQGGMIVDHLERQLNENQFGPYQNALTSLLDLIGQYPNAWPIFVVGQRILQDRHQYDNKRNLQLNEISKLQSNIQNIKKAQKKRTQIQNNSYKILNMVRQLSKLL